MEKLKTIFKNNAFTHHAYGIESHGLKISSIEELLDRERFSYIFSRHYDSLKIDDAREIKLLQSEKTSKQSIFIISFTQVNNETQNTLLKVIEEPRPNTVFFFIFPNAKKILETLRSRMELLSLNRVLDESARKISTHNYLELRLHERFNFNKEITDNKKKGDAIFTKTDMQLFLDDLEIFYIKQEDSKKRNLALGTILKAREYINANAASIKMILDLIASHI